MHSVILSLLLKHVPMQCSFADVLKLSRGDEVSVNEKKTDVSDKWAHKHATPLCQPFIPTKI